MNADRARLVILDAAENVMAGEGYAAVTTKRVAIEAGLKAPLVHYHFETTEKLLVALYRRTTERAEEALKRALLADNPILAIWEFNLDQSSTVLAAEFLALANHRPSFGEYMAADVERLRKLQSGALRSLGDFQIGGSEPLGGEAAAMLIAAVARALTAENAVGITTGHCGLRRLIAAALQHLLNSR